MLLLLLLLLGAAAGKQFRVTVGGREFHVVDFEVVLRACHCHRDDTFIAVGNEEIRKICDLPFRKVRMRDHD
jgi:hypothetical protein